MQVHHHQTQGATIIILNGASSAGKTRIAAALQSILPTPYLHVQLDAFESMLPEKHGEGMLFSWKTLYPRMLSGFHSSIASLASAGNDLIVDHVMITRDGEDDVLRHRSLDECADLLVQFRCYLIGVHCALGELLRRECQRG